MAGRRRICVVTGSRADYGLLHWPMKAIASDSSLQLQVVATGAHFSEEHGATWRTIESDGFTIDRKILAFPVQDSGPAIAAAMGEGLIGMANAINDLKPDLILVLGDRYEIFSAVAAALVCNVPVAHIAGGDVTAGAYDDAIRHAISKMAHVHFATTEVAARRLRQLGEDPGMVFVTGSPGVDAILRVERVPREVLERDLGIRFLQKNALVTFHPVTWGEMTSEDQLVALLQALREMRAEDPEWGFFFTGVNADNEFRKLDQLIKTFVSECPSAARFSALGTQRYVSMMACCSVVVGNSSSGIYEAPSLGVPSVNIGDRQSGRIKSNTVVDANPDVISIKTAMARALSLRGSVTTNPYGSGGASERIVSILKSLSTESLTSGKKFHDLHT